MTANQQYARWIRRAALAISGGVRLNSTAVQERLTTNVELDDVTRQWLAFLTPGTPNTTTDQSNANWNTISMWFSLANKPDFYTVAKTIFSSVRSGQGSLLSQGFVEYVDNQLHVRYQTNAGSGFLDHYYNVTILPDTLYHLVVSQRPLGNNSIWLNGVRLLPVTPVTGGASFETTGIFNGPLTIGCRHTQLRTYSFFTDITVYSVSVYPSQILDISCPYLFNGGRGTAAHLKRLVTHQNNMSTVTQYLPTTHFEFRPADYVSFGASATSLTGRGFFRPTLGTNNLHLHQGTAQAFVPARRAGTLIQALPFWT